LRLEKRGSAAADGRRKLAQLALVAGDVLADLREGSVGLGARGFQALPCSSRWWCICCLDARPARR
jgi:hypothetical protein